MTLKAEKPRNPAYPSALNTLGDHLRAKRLDLRLLQRQVAEQIGVDETTIYNWEGNRTEPAVGFIARINQFLGYCPYTPGLPISEWLKLVRQSLGYSQARMAEAIRVDKSTLRKWEAGKRQPAGKYLKRIKAYLNT